MSRVARPSNHWSTVAVLSLLLLLVSSLSAEELKPLQPFIDAASKGDIIIPPAGVYAGPVIIDEAITLDGKNGVTIDGGGKGSVIYLDTDGASIRNLRIINSGESHNDIDSAVQVRGNFNVIKDNVIEGTLFGIDLGQAENNILRRNKISSKKVEIGMRGDAIRLWYSFNNKIIDNEITNSRDFVVWYSGDNVIRGNSVSGGRYSLHFMYSKFNIVEDNHFFNNNTGIFLMYSDGLQIRNNYIASATGAAGVGIGFKETSDITIENNQILYCATGMYIDVSPYDPDSTNLMKNNLIAFNGIAVRFLNDWKGNQFFENKFKGNIAQVVVSGGGSANRNDWQGNYWDDYEGFDLDRDGTGDTPYELYAYADRLWMDVPRAQFFMGSIFLEVIDFLERLAPFSEPQLLLRDQAPQLAESTT
ncbi:MAG: nitrous oxide reductase family maturation protein NosD [Gammaproteobacteria bacterium]|nr:nitrous oxide reductase family maturation protein NosD [Gammaproteobacteria bacterium]